MLMPFLVDGMSRPWTMRNCGMESSGRNCYIIRALCTLQQVHIIWSKQLPLCLNPVNSRSFVAFLVNLDVRHEGYSEGKRLARGGKGFEPRPPQTANRHFYSSNFMRRTCTNWCFCLSLKFRGKNTIFGLHRSTKHCITACLVHRAKSSAAFYTPVTCEVESLLHIGNALSCIVAFLLLQFGFFGSFSALNCGFAHSNSGVRLVPTTLFFDTKSHPLSRGFKHMLFCLLYGWFQWKYALFASLFWALVASALREGWAIADDFCTAGLDVHH